MAQQLVIKTADLSKMGKGIVVLMCGPDLALTSAAKSLWDATGLDFARAAAAGRFAGKSGQILEIVAPTGLDADRLWVAGMPVDTTKQPLAPTARREQGGSLMGKIAQSHAAEVTIVAPTETLALADLAEFAAGLRLRHYRYDRFKTKRKLDEDNGEADTLTITLAVTDRRAADTAIADAMSGVEGTLLARELVNAPPNVLGPVEFADQARALSKLGIDVDILTETEMEKLGMGALLAVARGSAQPARLAIMQWHGGKKSQPPLAFVGKGVVFDSGGISIKPGGGMEDMKGDMGGAAAVTGLLKALALRKAKVNVVGVIGLVENMPDGNAYRPGDILTSMSGQTIEIVNTDAEGRLVLADALWYTQDRFKPKFMVNLATLTGAVLVSLGHDHAGMFSNDDGLADRLFQAGLASGEKVWRLPLGAAYDKLIESRFADMKNSGGRLGGSITAAQFLKRFVNDIPWAHLDIAGTAFGASPGDLNGSWASGFGVALLDRLVRDNYET